MAEAIFGSIAEVIFDLISAAVLTVCGLCTLYTGIKRRKDPKANNTLTVILILCGIVFAVSPFIRPTEGSRYTNEGIDYMAFAFMYAALVWLYTAIYRLFFQKRTENMQKLILGFSALVAFMMLLSAAILIVKLAFGLFLMIPKY